jgi:hypothetical protein
MKKLIIIIGLLTIAVSFYVVNRQMTANITYEPATTACSQFSSAFDDIFIEYDGKEPKCHDGDTTFIGSNIERWSCVYHNTVDSILEGVLNQDQPSICGPESKDAASELTFLAGQLEPWSLNDSLPEEEQIPITTDQTPSILQEYLRVYECALYEHETNLPASVLSVLYEEDKDNSPAFNLFNHTLRSLGDQERLTYEITRSRKALQQSLLLLSRGRPSGAMGGHLACLQRVSLDLRNIMGLAAEAGSCLPKSWNARDVLRDYTDREQPDT